jgi:pimeloyl-ACP methyl ester carboxylesterase
MASFQHDGLTFHYQRRGQGIPFVFQHGLGSDLSQPLELFVPPTGIELLSFDFRAHGETRPVGDPEKIGFRSFADDLGIFLDQLQIKQAVIGGISMGAGVALNFSLRYPKQVQGLVLSRPAWLDGPMTGFGTVFPKISQLIQEHGAKKSLEIFELSEDYRTALLDSPDVAASLLKQFASPRVEETCARLQRIPQDAPNYDRAEWKSIRVPALVLANRQDPVHPFEYGGIIAQQIPGAEFQELTSKSVSPQRHSQEVQRFIEDFLRRRFLSQ